MQKQLFERVLPPEETMYKAVKRRDSSYEGVFFFAVRTTGIFCRPRCSARTPNPENVRYYPTAQDALSAGYRPCQKCHPLEVFGTPPDWLRPLLEQVERDCTRRWTDQDFRDHGVQPEKLRRWFNQNHGMTFQGYLRSRRLAQALGQISQGEKSVTTAALDSGYESMSGFRDAFKKWCGETPAKIPSDASPLIANRIPSPLGPLVAVTRDANLVLLEFADRRMLETQFKRLVKLHRQPIVTGSNALLKQLGEELGEYFAGRRTSFEVPLECPGSEFQTEVWNRLLEIPYGETTTYDQLAKSIGRSGAQRAVGRANGDNRLAILIPCHRVIRSDGTLSGYGGGIWRKQRLLDLERASSLAMRCNCD